MAASLHWGPAVALSAALSLAIWTFPSVGEREDESLPGCELVAAYGAIFASRSGEEVFANDENRLEQLLWVLACSESLLSGDDEERYASLVQRLTGPQTSREERSERAFVMMELAAAVRPEDVIVHRRRVARRLIEGWRSIDEIVDNQGARQVLDDAGWVLARSSAVPFSRAGQYQAQCAEAGVPVPGPISTDPGWSHRTSLDDETTRYLFRTNWKSATAWTYQAADGGYCVALLRSQPDDSLAPAYFGAICTDRDEVDACFFDSIVYDGAGTRRLRPDEVLDADPGTFVHPKDGEDDCNACHLGANPFLVNPATKLGQLVQSTYLGSNVADRFVFTGLDGSPERWINYAAMQVPTHSPGCMGCHDIPAIPKQHNFCASIIERAANIMMPPKHWDDISPTHAHFWPDQNGCFDVGHGKLHDFFPSMVRIRSYCTGVPEKTCAP